MMSFAYGIFGILLFPIIAHSLQCVARVAKPGTSPILILSISAIIAHLLSVVLGAALTQPFYYWDASSIFGFGVMMYVFAFGAVYKSVSLQILLELTRRPGGAVALSTITDSLVSELICGRIEDLTDRGLVARDATSFAATDTGQTLASRIAWFRRQLAIGDTGLYDFNAADWNKPDVP
jgi:hypothetical protein